MSLEGRADPSILIVAAKWWPASARLAVALRRQGCRISAICPVGHPLRHVTGLNHIFGYGGLSPLLDLRRAMHESKPDVVVPCDDGAVAQLHALYELDTTLKSVIERSLGSPESYSIVDSRHQLLNVAVKANIKVPTTRIVATAEDLVKWHDEFSSGAVIKVDGESGGNGVRISNSLSESVVAWKELRAPCGFATACKRLAIDCDPLALWSRRRQGTREITVQEFIAGRPANSMVACWSGKVLASISVVVVSAEGQTGAATVVRVIQNRMMEEAAEKLVAQLNLSGFYGFDFIIKSGSSVPYLIEMNPRCTQLGHLELAGSSLARAFSTVLGAPSASPAQEAICSDTIALFPQALAAGEACRPYVESGYHDVPWEEPDLKDELMLVSWPRRRRIARIYHSFKPLNRAEPMLFEEIHTNAVGPETDIDGLAAPVTPFRLASRITGEG
jgi:predicted ATP-grasp superfamily ATP-dependent carboligase